jgi:hypothetical protein
VISAQSILNAKSFLECDLPTGKVSSKPPKNNRNSIFHDPGGQIKIVFAAFLFQLNQQCLLIVPERHSPATSITQKPQHCESCLIAVW